MLCVHCLSLVERGQQCPESPDHPLLDLRSDSDAAGLRRVWTRRRYDRDIGWMRVAAQVAAAVGAVAAMFFALSAWHESDRPLRETTCYLLPMLGLAGIFWALLDSLERARRRRFLAVPAARSADAQTFSGRVVDGGSLSSPLTDQHGCAYGAVLAADALLWHDGESAGVVVETDDGQRLTIGRGPVRMSFRERAGQPATRSELERHLEGFGPGGRAARNRMLVCAPFPFNYYEATLRPGDRVDIVARTCPVPTADGSGSAYRDAGIELQTRGVPWIRLRR